MQRCLIHYYLVVTGLDQATAEVLDLFACLDEQVPTCRRELYRYTLPCIARPDVKAGVPRATVDGQKVEIRVEAGKDSVIMAILDEIGGGWGKEVRTVSSEVSILSALCRCATGR